MFYNKIAQTENAASRCAETPPLSHRGGGGGVAFNFLPNLLTFINILSGAVYTKDLGAKDRIQVYGIAILFLVLLYNSPAGLVLYWTCNNIFSLAKNILHTIKYAQKIIFGVIFTGAALMDIYLLFKHPGDLPNRLLAVIIISSVFLLPFLKKITVEYKTKKLSRTVLLPASIYTASCAILFLLTEAVIPAALIASSVEEFSFIGNAGSPLVFILTTAEQSAGLFLFWTLAVYFLFSDRVRRILTFFMLITAGISLTCVFLIAENFGFLTPMMTFSEPKPFALIPSAYIINILLVCAISLVLFLFLKHGKTKIVIAAQSIACLALIGVTAVNLFKIQTDFNFAALRRSTQAENANALEPQFAFSKSGKNVLLIMLDCAVGFYVPYILDEKPALRSDLRGFTWYPNCVSFGNHTLVGALPIYGGYEYAPAAVNERDTVLLLDKQKEAYLLLPKLFSDKGYAVTVTDPPFDNYRMSNLAPFFDISGVKAENLNGMYTARWLKEHPDINTFDLEGFLKHNLIRFSFFKGAPLFLRLFIYDDGDWLNVSDNADNTLSDTVINDYALLDMLDRITTITETGNTYTAFYGHLPHDTVFLQTPDYTPSASVINKGNSQLSDDGRFHVTMASFLLLNKWFAYLKANGVYDNTRIIITSDHGRGSVNVKENIVLPNGDPLQSYNALLMVKDFDSNTSFESSPVFMTNADAALFALQDIVANPVNPFTGVPLQSDKARGIDIATIGALSTYRHSQFKYTIADDQWLHVRDDIFKPENWSAVFK
ncbi:MAG: YidC/Oxa1 family membrane protein insertase [Treponemataceae bacterium]|nr:MAG: YidC/Oxa1 family membrane protein insertase [Treponemataceae bacterium]